MADLDLALAATFDTSDVVQGGQAGAAAIDNVAKAQKGANQANKEASTAATNAAKAERDLAAATERVKATLDPTYAAQKKLNTALQEAKLAFDNGKISAEQYNRVQSLLSGSLKQTAVSAGSARAGGAQLGQQLQDISIQAQMGTSAFTIFAQQAGQVGTAMALMGGRIGTVGALLAGPLGAGLTLAIALLGPLALKFFAAGDAATTATRQIDGMRAAVERLAAAQGKASLADLGQAQVRSLQLEAEEKRAVAKLAALQKLQAPSGSPVAAIQAGLNATGVSDFARAKANLEAIRSEQSLTTAVVKGTEIRLQKTKELMALADQEAKDKKAHTASAAAGRKAEAAAESAANKAKREAEAASKRLGAELDALEVKYDKLGNGAKGYLTTLEEIARLENSGRISSSEALGLRFQASNASKAADNKRRSDGFDQLLGYTIGGEGDPLKAKGFDAAEIIKTIDRQREFGIEEEAKRAAAALRQGAQNVADVLGNGQLGRALGGLLQDLGVKGDPSKNIAGQIKKLGNDILGPELSGSIGKAVNGVFQGASNGQFASSIADKVGIKQSKTGAAVGGALGQFGFGPIGGFVGGIVGGTIGGLLKKTKSGSATLGNVNGEASIIGTSGNSASYRKTASTLGDSVLDSLDSIVSQLGGDLGDFSVSIGQRKKKFVVDASGRGRTKGSGTTKYDSAEEAAAAALANAIADGAVKGISPAVQRAITGSTDVQKALQDAINVQQLETDIKGIGGKLDGVFSNLDRVAEERLRLARKYGVDIVAVEKLNAEQREKAIADALESRTGALKSLLDDLKFGNLAEGDAFTKRNAVLVEITKAQADAEAGVEGAANKLADLQRQLVEFSKDSFGTAGPEYGNDRANAISSAEKVIQLENERIKLAAAQQETQTNALTTQNELTNEGNNLLAQQNTTLQSILARLSGAGAVGQQMANTVYRQPAVQY